MSRNILGRLFCGLDVHDMKKGGRKTCLCCGHVYWKVELFYLFFFFSSRLHKQKPGSISSQKGNKNRGLVMRKKLCQ